MTSTRKSLRGIAAAGIFVTVSLTGTAWADQVFNDDVIVGGSLCVGTDCVNGENFGADTLRLEENNLRIHFDDTSSTASFPRNDWRLIANDQSNGGASYLGIQDATAGRIPFRVEAGAPANALYVESDGDVGVKTANPVVDIHVVEGNTPTLRLEQDGSDGFAPQTWDIAGNEANFFIRDVTNGSKLFFRSEPGAPENSLYIDNSGDMGFGTNNPMANLHIRSTEDKGAPDAHLLVRNDSGVAANRRMIELSNLGGAFVVLENRQSDVRWAMVNANSNTSFLINDPDSDGLEFELTADGDLKIEGDFVANGTTLTVPDYVFDDGYELMPLSEIARFIESEGHLPGIPSAAKVSQSGLNVVQMQLSLLEKIEELTLHSIDLQAQIDGLRTR